MGKHAAGVKNGDTHFQNEWEWEIIKANKKETRKHAFDQENDQESKKTRKHALDQ